MKVVLEGGRVDCGDVMWTFKTGISWSNFARLPPVNVIEAAVNVKQLPIASQITGMLTSTAKCTFKTAQLFHSLTNK